MNNQTNGSLLNESTPVKKTGFVAIIGRPNTGKSTFINTLLGEKISITTKIPQTTRNKILAIYNDDESQIVFFDTPGIHESGKIFNEQINNAALSSLKDANVALYFIDLSRPSGEEERHVDSIISAVSIPVIRVYTKSDLEAKIEVLEGENICKISSVKKEGLDGLVSKIKGYLEEGPMYYPEDYYTFQTPNFRISEIIREKIFLHTKEELPHSVFVEVEEIEDTDELLRIMAYIYTESDSQKYILIGKGGSLLSTMGKEARLDLESIYGKKVFLSLRIKVSPKWRKDEKLLKKLFDK